jgi:hypothetical protein
LGFGVAFTPLVPSYALWAACAVALVLAVMLFVVKSRGAGVRATALALMVLALANPSFTREDREPLSSVAVVVVDKSPSQNFADRLAQTEAARAALAERLGRIPNLDASRPVRRTARPTARGCSRRWARRSPTCHPTGCPARFS